MLMLEAPYHAHYENIPFILRNARGILTYENTLEEVALLNPTTTDRIMRVISGRITESPTGGPPVMLWRLGVRDGFDYYPVCELESRLELQRILWKLQGHSG